MTSAVTSLSWFKSTVLRATETVEENELVVTVPPVRT